MTQATATRDRIIEKARELFYSEGTRAVTMDDLASKLGISKKTLYQAYSSKDELLQEILEQEYLKFQEFIDGQSKLNSNDIMLLMFNTLVYSEKLKKRISKRFLEELEKFHSTLFNEYWAKFKPDSDKYMLSFMHLAQEKGYIYSEINVKIVHRVIDMMIGQIHELMRSGEYVEDELKESITKAYMRGVFTAEGRKKLKKFIEKFNE